MYGKPFTVMTDHKPLEHLYNDPKSKTPARIEGWALKLQPYNSTVIYKAGKDNPANYYIEASKYRSPVQQQRSKRDRRIHQLCDHNANAVPKALSVDEIKSATVRQHSTSHNSRSQKWPMLQSWTQSPQANV